MTEVEVKAQISEESSIERLQAPKFLAARSDDIDLLYSAREYQELVDPGGRAFFAALGIPADKHTFLAPLVERHGMREAFSMLAHADLIGVPLERTLLYFFAKHDRVLQSIGMQLQQVCGSMFAKMELLPGAEFAGVATQSPKQGEEPALFPATFVNFNAKLAGFPLREDVTETARQQAFCMCLPKEVQRAVEAESRFFSEEDYGHIFAFIRWGMGTGCAEITSIESEYFAKLPEGELRAKLRDWDKILLLAFEHFVREATQGRRSAAAQEQEAQESDKLGVYVLLPSTDDGSKAAGTETNIPAADLGLGDRILAMLDAPKASTEKSKQIDALAQSGGYQSYCVMLASAFKSGERPSSDAVQMRWMKFVSSSEENEALKALSRHITSHGYRRADMWFDRYQELIASPGLTFLYNEGLPRWCRTERRCLIGASDHTAEMSKAIELAPLHPRGEEEIFGLTPDLMELAEKLREPEKLAVAARFLPKGFTVISNGAAVRDDWWNLHERRTPGWHVAAFHLPEQNRHPILRLTLHGEDGEFQSSISLGIKGGGVRSFDPDQIQTKVTHDGHYTRFPVYRLKPPKEGAPTIPSHKFWGGLTLQDAQVEYLHTLAVNQLMREAAPEVITATAVPLTARALSMLPIWQWHDTVWLPVHEYSVKFLGPEPISSNERLAVFHSAFTADVRLSQVLNRIIARSSQSAASVEAAREEIDSALRYLYTVNGEKINLTAQTPGLQDGRFAWRELFKYVRQVGEQNGDAALRIQACMEASLAVLAAVHGSGGHLGGSWNGKIGAIGGGAVTMRNIDAAGALHDLDRDIFLPWIRRPDLSMMSEAQHRAALPMMQWFDTLHWIETVSWSKNILFGLDLPADAELKVYKIGEYNNFLRFSEPQGELAASPLEGQARTEPLRRVLELLNSVCPEYRPTYEHYFERGKIAR